MGERTLLLMMKGVLVVTVLTMGAFIASGHPFLKPLGMATLIYIGSLYAVMRLLKWITAHIIRIRIAALAAIYVVMITGFAFAYWFMRPDEFAYADAIRESKAIREATDEAFRPLYDLNTRVHRLLVADAHAQASFQAAMNPVVGNPEERDDLLRSPKGFITLGNDYWVRFTRLMRPGVTLAFLDIRHRGEFSSFGGPVSVNEGEYVARLTEWEDAEGFQQSLRELISFVNARRNRLLLEAEKYLVGVKGLSFVDFLYFSSVTALTVGYGDIVPNAMRTRMLVIMQSMTSVFYVAYALTLLWPEEEVTEEE